MSRIKKKFIIFGTGTDGTNGQDVPANYTPSNYTPTQVASEGTDKISAHLKGIDAVVTGGGGGNLTVQNKSASFTASTADDVYIIDATSGTVTVTLPTAVGISGNLFRFNRTDTTLANAVIIDPAGAETIQGFSETRICSDGANMSIISDGTNWQILDKTYDVGVILDREAVSVNNTVTPVTNTWVTRALKVTEGGESMFSLDIPNKQFTLKPGKYEIKASFYARDLQQSEIRLSNISVPGTELEGETGDTDNGRGGTTYAILTGFINVTTDTIFQIQHRCSLATAQGFGLANSMENFEKYGRIEIKKLI